MRLLVQHRRDGVDNLDGLATGRRPKEVERTAHLRSIEQDCPPLAVRTVTATVARECRRPPAVRSAALGTQRRVVGMRPGAPAITSRATPTGAAAEATPVASPITAVATTATVVLLTTLPFASVPSAESLRTAVARTARPG